MSSSHSRWLMSLLIVCLAAGYFMAQSRVERESRQHSVSLFNPDAAGVSVFAEFLKAMKAAAPGAKRSALLDRKELESAGSLVMLSPSFPLSEREAKLVESYVRRGGKLLLSFHDEASFHNLQSVLKRLGMAIEIHEAPEFENGKPVTASPAASDDFFASTQSYAFYSNWQLNGPACVASSFACYVTEVPLGKGLVVLVAGLPPVANGMIAREANRDFAARWVTQAAPVIVDEYHHFFTDRSFLEVAQQPAFSLPALGLICLLLLFFRYARTEVSDPMLFDQVRAVRPPSHLHLQEKVLAGLWSEPGSFPAALEEHEQHLKRLFPEVGKSPLGSGGRGRNLSQAAFLREAGRLIAWHQQRLKQRRRRR